MKEELRKRERWLQIAERTNSAGLLEWDLSTGVAHWTPGLARILGLDSVTGTYHDILDRVHPDDIARVRRELARVAVSGERSPLELRVVRRDGEIRWLACSGEVFRRVDAEAGDPGRAIAVLTDVTALKWLAEQEHGARVRAEGEARRLTALQVATAALAEAADAEQLARALLGRAAAALGASGGVLLVAAPDGGWLSMTHSQDVPQSVRQKWQRVPLEADQPSPARDVMRGRRPLFLASREEFVLRYPDLAGDYDDACAHALAYLPLAVRDAMLGVLVLRFPTSRAFAPEEQATLCTLAGLGAQALLRVRLHDAERTARQEAERARADAERARADAERASNAKSRFLAIVSHELRTPLNSVIGYADLLLMQTRGALNLAQVAQVERIRAAALQQLDLVDGILVYSRLEAQREDLHPGPVDVAVLVRDVAETVRPAAERKGLTLRIELPDTELGILSDGGKLRQVLLNLAGNAVKFTRTGHVALAVTTRRDALIITVTDTGIGIDEDRIEHIWEPFTQGDQSNTR
ncbi:MAG TPA: PAS domain-containing sensor histidine kinase, partial [Longimicrobiales bacterium]|nr:PAS domain-containing sensor histidine kinase [Longimicrobiales bacterium]